MKNVIYYYSGTGNSLWVAQRLAQELGGCLVEPMLKTVPDESEYDLLGLSFPVHIWGVPGRVIQFLNQLGNIKANYVFGLAVNAGQVANTLVQLQGTAAKKGIPVKSGFDFKMPSNYIPWGDAGTKEEQQKLYNNALTKIQRVGQVIRNREEKPVEKGPFWQRMVFSQFYKMSTPQVPTVIRGFFLHDGNKTLFKHREVKILNGIKT